MAFVCQAEIQHQMHRARLIGEVRCKLNVPNLLTPASNNLLRLNLMRSAEQVSDLINSPIMCFFGT
jgi:hypothetical protein